MSNVTPTTTGSAAAKTSGSSATGKNTIADGVVSKVAGIAAREVRGVHDLGNGAARAIGAIRNAINQQDRSQGVSVEVGEKQVAADIVIVGGIVVDGTGAPGRPGTVVIDGERLRLIPAGAEPPNAARTSVRVQQTLRMTTRTSGSARHNSRVASMPSRPGNLMSMTTTCGCVHRPAVIASSASAAVATSRRPES